MLVDYLLIPRPHEHSMKFKTKLQIPFEVVPLPRSPSWNVNYAAPPFDSPPTVVCDGERGGSMETHGVSLWYALKTVKSDDKVCGRGGN